MKFAAQGGIVWAHADSLRRDETGKLDPARNVQFTNARIATGKGAIEWYFGWSIPTRWESPKTDPRFEKLVRSMDWKRPADGVMPLLEGELRYKADKELTAVRTVEIVDKSGAVTKAWSGYGDSLAWPGIALRSPGQLFATRVNERTFHVSGEKVRVESSAPVRAILSDYPDHKLTTRTENNATVIEPHGWQRGHWFEIRLG